MIRSAVCKLKLRTSRFLSCYLIKHDVKETRGISFICTATSLLYVESLQWRHMSVKAGLKSPATRLIQQFVHVNNEENIKAPHYRPFVKGM